MTTILSDFTEVQGGCDRPDISGRVYAYLDDPINEPAAEDIEDHLLGCRDCRELVLMALNLRRAARRASLAEGEENAEVVRLADFRKECP